VNEITFTYSTFYKWQNLIAMAVPIILTLILIPSVLKQGMGKAHIFLFLFLLFAASYFLYLHIQRWKEPIKIHVNKKGIISELVNSEKKPIQWADIVTIQVDELYKTKKIIIVSKDNLNSIIFYDSIKDYQNLIKIIDNKNTGEFKEIQGRFR